MSNDLLTIVQYGWPGVGALLAYWGGKMASRFFDAHLNLMNALVEKLSDINTATQDTKAKVESLLARARDSRHDGD